MSEKQITDLPKRPCPVCGSEESKVLFTRSFSPIEGSLFDGYDVVICKQCGLGFADHIPTQAEFDEYYTASSKYGNEQRDGAESGFDRERFQDIEFLIRKFIPSKLSHILDIGCATGGLLKVLKKSGFPNLTGTDPSPACAETARRLHDIRVLAKTLGNMDSLDETFDFLILVGIVEHVRDLRESLVQIRRLLSPGGRVYIEVPDASRFAAWPDAPYQQFSTEHINFFSKTSLTNLMRANGFSEVFVGQDAREQSYGTIAPVVTAVYQRDDANLPKLAQDTETERGLMEYIQSSKATADGIQRTIAEIAKSKKPIIVWGVGTHTLWLMKTSKLMEANITAFVDSNSRYHGKELNGIPIIGSDDIKGMDQPILISSRVFQREIENQIRNELAIKNELIRLYTV